MIRKIDMSIQSESLSIQCGVDIHSDKGYQLATHRQQAEFEKKRNYQYMETIQEQETKAILAMGEAIKALNQQLSDANRSLRIANDRIAQLESEVYGGPTK